MMESLADFEKRWELSQLVKNLCSQDESIHTERENQAVTDSIASMLYRTEYAIFGLYMPLYW
jgi:hypothetical protein